VSNKFIKEAHNTLDSQIRNHAMKINFDEKVTEFENFGYDD